MPQSLIVSNTERNRIMIVDDNDRYSGLLGDFFKKQKSGCEIDRACSAKSALAMLTQKGVLHYDMIVTDITMESQISGLIFLRKIRTCGYKGIAAVASTGFDVPGITALSCLFLGFLGVHYIIPKAKLVNGTPVLHPTFFSIPNLQSASKTRLVKNKAGKK